MLKNLFAIVVGATTSTELVVSPDVLKALEAEAGGYAFTPASPSGLYPPFVCGIPVRVDESKPEGYYQLLARLTDPI